MNERINIDCLTKDEIFINFERMNSYVVRAGLAHQIVNDKTGTDRGIAVSINGRKDFRKLEEDVVYFYTEPHTYVASQPMPYGKTIKID